MVEAVDLETERAHKPASTPTRAWTVPLWFCLLSGSVSRCQWYRARPLTSHKSRQVRAGTSTKMRAEGIP